MTSVDGGMFFLVQWELPWLKGQGARALPLTTTAVPKDLVFLNWGYSLIGFIMMPIHLFRTSGCLDGQTTK